MKFTNGAHWNVWKDEEQKLGLREQLVRLFSQLADNFVRVIKFSLRLVSLVTYHCVRGIVPTHLWSSEFPSISPESPPVLNGWIGSGRFRAAWSRVYEQSPARQHTEMGRPHFSSRSLQLCSLYAAQLPITNLRFYIWAGARRLLILLCMSKRAHSPLFPKNRSLIC